MSVIPNVVFIRVIWDAHTVSFPLRIPGIQIKEIHVQPEPSHPYGRKGLTLAAAWDQVAKPEQHGMLIVDGDVMIDPWDVIRMMEAISNEPTAVHVAPAKLWKTATNSQELWTWGHWRDERSQAWTEDPNYFAFNFTFLPRRLLEICITKGLRSWKFPRVDMNVSEQAQRAGIPVRVVKDCAPKHMHY